MFNLIIVQPIFNLLVLIYAVLPGHNFGLAIIIFTIVVRMLMLPLVKKQLHQVKVMRKLQPELKRIKKEAAGNRQRESMMMMELYKERGVNPFGQIGVMLLQVPILIGLYLGLKRIMNNPHELVSFAYPVLQHFSWMKELASNIHLFDNTLFGFVDLTKSALGPHGGVYWPAMIIVVASAAIQYFQSKQLSPDDKDARSLRQIFKQGTKGGKQPDQAEVNAAASRSIRIFLPIMVFLFTVHIASALSLYWLVGGLVAFVQQYLILREDAEEMDREAGPTAATRAQKAVEAEVVSDRPAAPSPKSAKKHKGSKRRKK